MTDTPVELDKHRGMASQKATDIRRVLAEAEANAKVLRDRQSVLESQLLSAPAASWQEAAAKARYVLNLYAAGLAPRPRAVLVRFRWSEPRRGTCSRGWPLRHGWCAATASREGPWQRWRPSTPSSPRQ